MSASSVVLAEAIRNIRHIREAALRDAMAIAAQVEAHVDDAAFLAITSEEGIRAFGLGHYFGRRKVYVEIERMIAREAAAPDVADRDDDGDG